MKSFIKENLPQSGKQKQLLWEGKIITQRHTNGILSRQETWGLLQEHNLSTKTNSRLPF
jgi:hypothetical protein